MGVSTADVRVLGMDQDPFLPGYQLKISLQGISPMIWRRFLVPETLTLYELHRLVQIGFDWEDYHLHEFKVGARLFTTQWTGQRHWKEGKQELTLADLALRVRQKFTYIYDFGDYWVHDIRVEGKKNFDPQKRYPTCTGGARAAPPEDIGGLPGFQRFLASDAHFDCDGFEYAEEDEMRKDFDPAHFSRREINAALHEEWHPAPA